MSIFAASFYRRLLAALLLISTLGIFPPSAIASEDTPPLVSNPVISPTSLPYEGGQVTICADVLDDLGVFMVYAELVGPDSTPLNTQMFYAGEISYCGWIQMGPNFTDNPAGWGVYVAATDINGQTTTEFAGEFQIAEQPQFDEAPVAYNPAVEPRDLPSEGGITAISASATDNRGISEVYAAVTPPDGPTFTVALEPNDLGRYAGLFQMPPNTGTTPFVYAIEIVALDDIGQPGTVDAGLLTVAAPVDRGPLMIRPLSPSFGRVQLGDRGLVTVEIRNPNSSPASVRGRVLQPKAPFFLRGSEALRFHLKPGQTKTFVVGFRPSELGRQEGTLIVRLTGAHDQDIAVELSGRGVRAPR